MSVLSLLQPYSSSKGGLSLGYRCHKDVRAERKRLLLVTLLLLT